RRRSRGALDTPADVGNALQRQVDNAEPRVDVGCGIGERVDACDLSAQAERKAAIGTLTGISRRHAAACELCRQVVELVTKCDNRRSDVGGSAVYAIDCHDVELLTSIASAGR